MKKQLCMLLSVCLLTTAFAVSVNAESKVYNRYTCVGNVKGYMQLTATASSTFSEVGTASASSHTIYASNRVLNANGNMVNDQDTISVSPPVGTTYAATETRSYSFANGYQAFGTYEVENTSDEDDYWYDTIFMVRGIDF